MEEAEQALNQASRLGLSNEPLVLQIGKALFQLGQNQMAESVMLRLSSNASAESTLLLGDVLAAQNKHELAAETYDRASKLNASSEADRKVAEKRAREMRAFLGRA